MPAIRDLGRQRNFAAMELGVAAVPTGAEQAGAPAQTRACAPSNQASLSRSCTTSPTITRVGACT